MQVMPEEELGQVEAALGRISQAHATTEGRLHETSAGLAALTQADPVDLVDREAYGALLAQQQALGAAMLEQQAERALLLKQRDRLRAHVGGQRAQSARADWARIEQALQGLLADARWLMYGEHSGVNPRTPAHGTLLETYRALRELEGEARRMQEDYNAFAWAGMPKLGRDLAMPESFRDFAAVLLGVEPPTGEWFTGHQVPNLRRVQ